MQKVLEWRIEECEVERAKMRRFGEQLQQLEQELGVLTAENRAVRTRVLQTAVLESFDLSPIPAFEERLKKAGILLQARKATVLIAIGEQRQKLLESQRRVDLLQKLRDRRLAEWVGALNVENERFAAEAFLGRWTASRTDQSRRRLELNVAKSS